jgi:signal transduction histidine kinase
MPADGCCNSRSVTSVEGERARQDRLAADEQAALRRFAALVGEGATTNVLVAAVVDEVAHVLDVPAVLLARYEPDRTMTVLATVSGLGFEVGSRWPLDGPSVSATVLDTGAPARMDDYSNVEGAIAGGVRAAGLPATVGAPIIVDRAVWGVIVAGTREPAALPADSEERLADFTTLVAISIANAESRERQRRLAETQRALRRIATMVAEGASTSDVCAVVVEEVAAALETSAVSLLRREPGGFASVVASRNVAGFVPGSRWPLDGPSLTRTVLETGRPARVDDYGPLEGAIAAKARAVGAASSVGVPILVDGRTWGVIALGAAPGERLPAETVHDLQDFVDLVSTAISKADQADRERMLADTRSALRHVATLVAEHATLDELFQAVAEKVALILDAPCASVVQFDADDSSLIVGSFANPSLPVGSRWPHAGPSLNALVARTGRPARIDHGDLPGPVSAMGAPASGMQVGVGVPIVVDGSVWGMIGVGSREGLAWLPPDIEDRLVGFTDLVATGISKALAYEDLQRLAGEQAALRRVATLVAQASPPTEIFAAVAEEVARVLSLRTIEIVRYGVETATVIASFHSHLPLGSTWPLDGGSVIRTVHSTGRPARIDDFSTLTGTIAESATNAGFLAAIGAPIVVSGATWGCIVARSRDEEPIPPEAEMRLTHFTELVAIAIANLQAHDELQSLAGEQAALRRVATLVARGASPGDLFTAVATEVADVLGVSAALVDRYDPDGAAITLGVSHEPDWVAADIVLQPGTRWPPDAGSLTAQVRQTERAARVSSNSELAGAIGETSRAAGLGAGCSAPIVVDGAVWGAIRVFSRIGAVLPPDTETRLEAFTELVAMAISNAAARGDLIASRARVVAAGDDARRRIERNLHDGTQQRLIALGLDVQHVRASLPPKRDDLDLELVRMQGDIESILEDLRELSRGLHPPLLSRRGLLPALRALARRSPIPVDIDVELRQRPPDTVEMALYYVAAEALTNAIKHARATAVSMNLETDHVGYPFQVGLDGRGSTGNLHLTIADDGIGGASLSGGSGLIGLVDRIDSLGGRLVVESPPGLGTRISVVIPLAPEAG